MELIQVALIVVFCILVVVFIVKKLIMAAVVIFIIGVLFNLGFSMNGSEVMEKFKLGEYLNNDTSTKVASFFDDFESRREQFGVVNVDKVKEDSSAALTKGIEIVINGSKQLISNQDEFINTMIDKLRGSGSENIAFEDLKASFMSEYGMSDENSTYLAEKIVEGLK